MHVVSGICGASGTDTGMPSAEKPARDSVYRGNGTFLRRGDLVQGDLSAG